jgi:hypothetical protein
MFTRKSHAPTSGHLEENLRVFDSAPEFIHTPAALDNVDYKVKAAQEQLFELRRQQEEIERQKQHLENLRLKQERFVAGKRDLIEKISRANDHVVDELHDAQKRSDELRITHEEFSRHLEILKTLQPEKWHRTQVNEELDKALAAIEDAENGFSKGLCRLHMMTPPEPPSYSGPVSLGDANAPVFSTSTSNADDWMVWMKRGFAFTLPLMATVLVAIVLILIKF